MLKLKALLTLLIVSLTFATCGFTFAPLEPSKSSTAFQYNQLKLGDTVNSMLAKFGKPRFTQPDYLHHTKITYYYYKDNSRIGINSNTGEVIDIFIKSDYYAQKNDVKQGDTLYKLQQLYGISKKQHLEGKLYYPYAYNEAKLLFQLEPTTNSVLAIRITNLPLEEDDLEYLPDNATSEKLNPLIADKRIQISPLIKTSFKPYNPALKIKSTNP